MLFIRLFILCLALNLCAIASESPAFKEVQVDSIVRSLNTKKIRDVKKLSQFLCAPFHTDAEKVRAIFCWITLNIAYDLHSYYVNKTIRYSKKNGEYDADALERFWYTNAKQTIIRRKGVCSEYASLFFFLCKEAGIESQVVVGFARNPDDKLSPFTRKLKANHAWNAVKINETWHLLDVTWASGYCDEKAKKFTRDYNSFYYLTPPEKMIGSHYPEDKEWQMMENPLSVKEFVKSKKKARA